MTIKKAVEQGLKAIPHQKLTANSHVWGNLSSRLSLDSHQESLNSNGFPLDFTHMNWEDKWLRKAKKYYKN